MRASDADRDRVAEELREHCATGRITLDELQERLDAVYGARTHGDLDRVTADLPEADLYERPVPVRQGSSAPAPRRQGQEVATVAWSAWALVSGLNLAIWMVLGVAVEFVYPWWIWVAGPWGAYLLLGALFGRRRS
ncbi:DUF1707 SHOCT-like domain-containing protein [Thermomonospora umbrina]|nr:DUF1707 domain-containing protein [Thermomonospora umbrina]